MELNYRQAGVDIDLANATKSSMAAEINNQDPLVVNKLGAFSSLYQCEFSAYKNPLLVLKTEEPGSKQLLAFQYGRLESICQDMIHHLINDCIVMGARPLTVQDCIVCGRMEKEVILRLVKAMASTCRANGCTLTGGETSEQPGVLQPGQYVLSSSIVGLVDREKVIDGTRIREDDIVIGVESSGLHTNGYTLIRAILDREPGIAGECVAGTATTFLELILEPHRCYYLALKDLFTADTLSGLAHITGGGIRENLNRILPDTLSAEIDLTAYRILPLYKFLKQRCCLADDEMLRTFNLSIGLTIVARPAGVERMINHLAARGMNAYPIGKIIPGDGSVIPSGKLPW